MMTHVWDVLYRDGSDAFRFFPNEELMRFVGRMRSSRVDLENTFALEVGCGNGANLWALAKSGMHSFGVDYALAGLTLAEEVIDSWGVSAHLALSDARDLPFPGGKFDAVVDIVSLQHLTWSDHNVAYAEIYRVLRGGGRFFSVHMGRDSWDYEHGGGRVIDYHTFDDTPSLDAIYSNLGTVCMPEAADIKSLLAQKGFASIEIEEIRKSYANRSKWAQYLVVTAERLDVPVLE